MAFAFDAIRLRNGRTYDFAGSIESVRTSDDDSVRVETEGAVQDESSQTERTVTRTGLGAAIGAVIGSVFVQGRNDLDLMNGTEFRIRASAPR